MCEKEPTIREAGADRHIDMKSILFQKHSTLILLIVCARAVQLLSSALSGA